MVFQQSVEFLMRLNCVAMTLVNFAVDFGLRLVLLYCESPHHNVLLDFGSEHKLLVILRIIHHNFHLDCLSK